MKNSFNLNSSEWCDIIFEGKNKAYGAFELRQSSSKRHLVAFGFILILAIFISFLPSIINKIEAANAPRTEGVNDKYRVIEIDQIKEEPIADLIKPEIPEPPVYRKMEKFVPPTIVDNDTEIKPDQEMVSVSDVLDNKDAVIGAFSVKDGSTDVSAEIKKFRDDVMNEGNGSGTAKEVPPLITAEFPPQYPGGTQEMYRYIAETLKYPVAEQEMGIQGRVTIRFVVSKTGDIKDIQILKGVSPNCDKEAIRVLKSMPRWIPGKQNGHPVAVYFTIPIVYQLKS
ncbi:energy transducer TonB [Dysgonomonas sp. 511]|uniref:energy transducer TonB n=1 Tax=Dysgonomonas sp. 511 TaxID=2302930 RepID=UPI0013D06DCF|nr:energy transducer TonB [Dysgonomonas sp. 511]NDV78164.1 energy transducer TonB [Dysgonomonas sp. 511]